MYIYTHISREKGGFLDTIMLYEIRISGTLYLIINISRDVITVYELNVSFSFLLYRASLRNNFISHTNPGVFLVSARRPNLHSFFSLSSFFLSRYFEITF